MSNQDLLGFLPLVLIVLAFWFLVIRPQRKRQHEMSRLQSSVEAGSEVMLGSGIYGTVTATADDTLQLQVAPGTSIKVARQAVVRVIDGTDEASSAPPQRADESPNVADEQ